jgi:hypothetical protein
VTPPRPSPYGAASHALGAVWVVCACVTLVDAAATEAARYAVGAGLLAGWWAWHGPRLALGAVTGGPR